MQHTLSVNHRRLRHSAIIIAISGTFRIRKRLRRFARTGAGARSDAERGRLFSDFDEAPRGTFTVAEVEPGP